MGLKLRRSNVSVTPRPHGIEPRCIQTSGIFRLPVEVILDILAHFEDTHRKICPAGRILSLDLPNLYPEHVERSTVMRRLTMTCWHLRNVLFPLLWKYMEGRTRFSSHRAPFKWSRRSPHNGLYAQCSYLLLNPTVGFYVQTLSVDLYFKDAPKNFMTKFVDCLIQLPNLRTLEVFGTSDVEAMTKGLKRKSARFPGIRELGISDSTANLIGNCPNVETITALPRLSMEGATVLSSRGGELKKLKRAVGIDENRVQLVVQGCPYLQEIGIKGSTTFFRERTPVANIIVAEHLRSLKHLAVVELEYNTFVSYGIEREIRKDKRETFLKEWTGLLIPVLKDSPSKERKFLRWKFSEIRRFCIRGYTGVVENGKLEVLPETLLAP